MLSGKILLAPQIDIDECEDHQCQNNATCVDLSLTDFDAIDSLSYYCECEDGYQGKLGICILFL